MFDGTSQILVIITFLAQRCDFNKKSAIGPVRSIVLFFIYEVSMEIPDLTKLSLTDVNNTVSQASGLFYVEEQTYHQSVGMNQSSLKNLIRSPEYYKFRKENPMQQTESMMFGSAVHTAILEPQLFDDLYAIIPKVDKRTKAGKVKWAIFEEENQGKTLLKEEQAERIRDIVKKVKSKVSILNYIDNGFKEVSFYGEMNGILCRGRADNLIPDLGMIVDIKTTQDARPIEFQRSAIKYGYDIQSAYYLDLASKVTGVQFDKFIFITIESNAPHGMQVYVADPVLVEIGRTKYQQGMEIYNECLAKDEWPDYEDKVLNLAPPIWAL